MSEKGGQERERRELHKNVGRIADALEKLASDPEIEVEAGPALCPNCGQFNPTVTVFPTEGEGQLNDYILVAECHHCNRTFYGYVESWSMYAQRAALEGDLEDRKRRAGISE